MTNNKAIELLDNLLGMIEDNHGNDYDKAIHMAIDALTADMDDSISRQAAIDAAWFLHPDDRDALRNTLKELPPAQPKSQWIPCSDQKKLPKEKDGRVLITLDGEVTTAIYSEFSKTWYIGDMCGVSDRVPTAWMPRPKPYRSK